MATFLLLGAGITAVGLVSTAWMDKWPALQTLLAHLPRLIERLPGAEEGIHANELAGALLLFLPVSLALVWIPGAGHRWWARGLRMVALLLSLFFGGVLLLTQSRSAWLGAVVGLGVMALVRWRWARWLLPFAVIALAVGLWVVGPQAAVQTVLASADQAGAGGLANVANLEGRVEVWSRALYAIQDFPFTGCGLGTFRRVVPLLYPLFLTGPDFDVAHAHNVFLQVALDLGLPGLIAYLALVGTALWMAWRVARSPGLARDPRRGLAVGLVGSLVAFHVYGLTDAIALGAKPGVALWLVLALASVLWENEGDTDHTDFTDLGPELVSDRSE